MVAKLREAIITGSLKPGDRLAYRDLAQRLGVSVTPVRIALRELANEGLVEMRAHTGARVSPLSTDELEEIFATRIGIEGWLARHGAERLTDEDVAAMTEALEGLRRAERGNDLSGYLNHSWAMRAACYARRPEAEALRPLPDPLRALEPVRLPDDRRRGEAEALAEEMEVFCTACLARDGEASEQAIRTALQTTLLYLSDAFDTIAAGAAE